MTVDQLITRPGYPAVIIAIRTVLAGIALAFSATPAFAQIYQCADAGGRTVFQQVPCAGGNVMNVQPASGYSEPRKTETAPAPHESVEAKGAAPMTNAKRIEANTQASIRERARRSISTATSASARSTRWPATSTRTSKTFTAKRMPHSAPASRPRSRRNATLRTARW